MTLRNLPVTPAAAVQSGGTVDAQFWTRLWSAPSVLVLVVLGICCRSFAESQLWEREIPGPAEPDVSQVFPPLLWVLWDV